MGTKRSGHPRACSELSAAVSVAYGASTHLESLCDLPVLASPCGFPLRCRAAPLTAMIPVRATKWRVRAQFHDQCIVRYRTQCWRCGVVRQGRSGAVRPVSGEDPVGGEPVATAVQLRALERTLRLSTICQNGCQRVLAEQVRDEGGASGQMDAEGDRGWRHLGYRGRGFSSKCRARPFTAALGLTSRILFF